MNTPQGPTYPLIYTTASWYVSSPTTIKPCPYMLCYKALYLPLFTMWAIPSFVNLFISWLNTHISSCKTWKNISSLLKAICIIINILLFVFLTFKISNSSYNFCLYKLFSNYISTFSRGLVNMKRLCIAKCVCVCVIGFHV